MTNRRVLVTGASGGMGSATVRRFLAGGEQVLAIDVDSAGLKQLSTHCDSSALTTFSLDLADVKAIEARVADIGSTGPIHVVVNAAGAISWKEFGDLTIEDWENVMSVNVRAPFVLAKAAVSYMPAGSVIVNVTSISAEVASSELVHYSASKGALKQLTKAMAVALGPAGIRVVAVGPGSTLSPLNAHRFQDPGFAEKVRSEIPLGRLAEPEDIASVIEFVASEGARHITGVTLYVDGGFLAKR